MNKPFSMDYVLRETIKHMRTPIAISTQKTIARLPEFEGNAAMVTELLNTLASLNALDKMMESVRVNNADLIDKDDK